MKVTTARLVILFKSSLVLLFIHRILKKRWDMVNFTTFSKSVTERFIYSLVYEVSESHGRELVSKEVKDPPLR